MVAPHREIGAFTLSQRARSTSRFTGLRSPRTFEPFHRVPVAFPERIYGDRELSDPGVGEVLSLQYLQCSACELVFGEKIAPTPDHYVYDFESPAGTRVATLVDGGS